MKRFVPLVLALSLAVWMGACASSGATSGGATAADGVQAAELTAQGQIDLPTNQWTKDAQKNLTLARLREPGSAARRDLFQSALDAALQSIKNAPDNARGYYLAGRAYFRLGDYVGADSVLATAVELYPQYEQRVNVLRQNAWATAFNQGIEAAQAGRIADAIALYRKADLIYRRRPQALLNLGRLYVQQDKAAKALQAYRDALAILQGPKPASLTEEEVAQWAEWEENVKLYISQLSGQSGIAYFNAEKYKKAVAAFRASLESNPYARGARSNLATALYLRTKELTTAIQEADGAPAEELETELVRVYRDLIDAANRVLEIDPYNRNAMRLLFFGYQGLQQYVEDPQERERLSARAQELSKRYRTLPFEIMNPSAQVGESRITISGELRNLKLDQGESVTLRFTFIGQGGEPIGTKEVTVTAPAAQKATTFEVVLETNESLLGYKYELVEQG